MVETDGGRLKLEWGMLRARSGERVEDLLWWEGERLLGFLGFYGFGSTLELAGMVAPEARRRGIGTALLDAAVPLYLRQGLREVLLIVPRSSVAGQRLALSRGGVLDHSEHALVLSSAPVGGRDEPALGLRQVTTAGLPFVLRMLEQAFGEPAPDEMAADLESSRGRTLLIEMSGSAVGTLRITRDEDDAAIYGFAVDPPRQGQGIGRNALRRAGEQLLSAGARRVRLEVAVDNDRALGLYTSLGFTPVATEDYFALPLS